MCTVLQLLVSVSEQLWIFRRCKTGRLLALYPLILPWYCRHQTPSWVSNLLMQTTSSGEPTTNIKLNETVCHRGQIHSHALEFLILVHICPSSRSDWLCFVCRSFGLLFFASSDHFVQFFYHGSNTVIKYSRGMRPLPPGFHVTHSHVLANLMKISIHAWLA